MLGFFLHSSLSFDAVGAASRRLLCEEVGENGRGGTREFERLSPKSKGFLEFQVFAFRGSQSRGRLNGPQLDNSSLSFSSLRLICRGISAYDTATVEFLVFCRLS